MPLLYFWRHSWPCRGWNQTSLKLFSLARYAGHARQPGWGGSMVLRCHIAGGNCVCWSSSHACDVERAVSEPGAMVLPAAKLTAADER